MAKQKTSREICPLCGKEFASRAEHDEHKEIVHNTMNRKTNLDAGHNPREIEPADNKPTTELPPGEENLERASSPKESKSAAKSKRAGR
ncbi:MAG: hypothetical protein WB987_04940 [Candidatus Acidiferrales bacterium]